MNNKMFRSRLSSILMIGALVLSIFSPITAQKRELIQDDDNTKTLKRTALVIGNGDYTNARKLVNPVNDATDMAKSLTELGFEVISGTNLNLKTMKDKVREFGDKLKANGGVGLLYYAGHGIQVNSKNYLIPIEADIQREDEIEDTALNFDLILRKMATANNGLNIVILDACRNNPFARSWSRDVSDGGLAQISAPTGTFIAYATSPDRTASDGTGRNGLYTSELLKVITKPNVKLEDAFKQVTIAVDRASSGNQVPWTSSSLRGEFYFRALGQNKNTVVNPLPTDKQPEQIIVAKDRAAQERETWDLVKDSGDPEDYRYFLKEFPTGINAEKAKIKLDELVWSSAKVSNNKAKVQAYVNEFPNGTNIIAARLLLRQLEAKETTTTNPTTGGTTNPTTAVTAGAIRKNSIGMELVWIPPGEFMMGSEIRKEEKPVHKVTIKDGFWMGKYEVTVAQYEKVTGRKAEWNSECQQCPYSLGDAGNISQSADDFIALLNDKKDGYIYSLPSEAQWEYAARAGTTGMFAGNLNDMGWYRANAGDKVHPVGQKLPNAFGLYDMHGNVGELCLDIQRDYLNTPIDGSANLRGESTDLRISRGGSHFDDLMNVRSSSRYFYRANHIGFRLVARAM